MQTMQLPASYEVMRPVVEHDFFDHRSVPQLEAYLSEQVSTSTYDFEANKALLKLYQFFPDLLKEEVVTQLVVKSLMNLPSMDLRSLLSIAPESALRSTPVSNVKRAGDALEMAQFREFWEMQRLGDLSMAKNIAGFDDQIRRFIVGVLSATCQSSTRVYVEQCLGLNAGGLDAYAQKYSAVLTVKGDAVEFTRNDFNQCKPKQFKQHVEFDRVLKVVKKLSVT